MRERERERPKETNKRALLILSHSIGSNSDDSSRGNERQDLRLLQTITTGATSKESE